MSNADLPEILPLTCERRGGSERRPYARAPHETEQRAHQELSGQTVECDAREQPMPRIAERAGRSREQIRERGNEQNGAECCEHDPACGAQRAGIDGRAGGGERDADDGE